MLCKPHENPEKNENVMKNEAVEENSCVPDENLMNMPEEYKVAQNSSDGIIDNDITDQFRKQQRKINTLKIRLQKVISEKKKLERDRQATYKNVLTSLFTQDQIRNLILQQRSDGKPKRIKWSNATIKKALRLKFACGNTGYDELLRQGFPLPSRRTLSRRIEHIKFRLY